MKPKLATQLGVGVLTWRARERTSDRYGTVFLMEDGHTSHSLSEPPLTLDSNAVRSVKGARGTLVAEVLSPRKSTHIGDVFRGIFPSVPEINERIVLGSGTVFVSDGAVGLFPDDNRETDWLDPNALYRAHEQLVRLTFEQESGE